LVEEKESPPKQHLPQHGAIILATVLSVIGVCTMAGSILIESLTPRFPNPGGFNLGFNVTRPFNATRTFDVQVVAQRVPTNFTYASWLNILGFACFIGITIILVALLFQSRS
jgi:uncharacterized membrane protein YgdD (TMEM256/DUF423 family)